MSQNKNGKFASRWGFVLAAVGSAVGMANVWGFPAKMAAGGGFAFLIPYFIFIALFSTVALSAEFAIGRWAKTGTLGSYRKAFANRSPKLGNVGGAVGWLPLVGSLGISIGYAVIIAYLLKALFDSVTGTLMQVDTGAWFNSFSATGYSVIPFHIIVVAVTLVTLLLGAKSIEKTNKVMMPIFFIIFVGLAVWVAFLPGATEGYKLMFTPDWSKLLDPNVWITAMGQAFFSLSVTGSGMLVYGAYLDKNGSVVPLSIRTAIFDTIAALVAALVVIPACSVFAPDSMGGPGMLFVAMPSIMQTMGVFGQILAIFLYVAMIFAGISSLQNMFEAVSESLLNRFPKLKRWIVLTVLGLVCFGIGVNMEAISSWGPWMDIVSIYIIPIGATIGAVTWFYVMRKQDFMDQINLGSGRKMGNIWYCTGRYLYVPCALILCLIALITKTAF